MIIRLESPPDIAETGAVLWKIPAHLMPPLPGTLSARDIEFRLKPEFHLTVFGRAEAMVFVGAGGAVRLTQWRDAWRQLDDRIELLDELWLLRKQDPGAGADHALAVACRAPAISVGRRLLSTWTGSDLQERPPHITIFCVNDPHGIAIASRDALLERCVERGSWGSFGLAMKQR